MAASMKMTVFWDVAPCCLVEVYRRFRCACCLHHQGDDRPTQRNTPENSHLQDNVYPHVSSPKPFNEFLLNLVREVYTKKKKLSGVHFRPCLSTTAPTVQIELHELSENGERLHSQCWSHLIKIEHAVEL
jgi:hypothetical protein